MNNKRTFYGHGKLLLSGEYFVLDGAQALAIPTSYGQSLCVEYFPSFNPLLTWKAYDNEGNVWVKSKFEFWHFDCLDENPPPETLQLQRILRQARKQNSHFLRDEGSVLVETHLNFPLDWGLGSSSSLIYNIAQWAYIGPFELLFKTYGGSGYDIACVQSDGPILYEKKPEGPIWSLIEFDPPFKDHIYFVFLGQKANTKQGIAMYKRRRPYSAEIITALSHITRDIIQAKSMEEFNFLVQAHEKLIACSLDLLRIKDQLFPNFWGEIKSLGTWGGDFVMVTSDRKALETRQYFKERGYPIFISYKEMIFPHGEKTFKRSKKQHGQYEQRGFLQ